MCWTDKDGVLSGEKREDQVLLNSQDGQELGVFLPRLSRVERSQACGTMPASFLHFHTQSSALRTKGFPSYGSKKISAKSEAGWLQKQATFCIMNQRGEQVTVTQAWVLCFQPAERRGNISDDADDEELLRITLGMQPSETVLLVCEVSPLVSDI